MIVSVDKRKQTHHIGYSKKKKTKTSMFMNEGKKIEVEQKKTIKGVTSKS